MELLNDSGGTLKGKKCYGYMHDYGWDEGGQWHYQPILDYDIQIKLMDGKYKSIALLEPYYSQVMLGVATCPAGNDTMHLSSPGEPHDKWKLLKTRADVWLSRM